MDILLRLVGGYPQRTDLRCFQPQVVLQRLDAAHLLRRLDGAVRHVLAVDEAGELHHALVGLDVDRRGGARPDVGGDRGLYLGGERGVVGEFAGAALSLGGRGAAGDAERRGERNADCCKYWFHRLLLLVGLAGPGFRPPPVCLFTRSSSSGSRTAAPSPGRSGTDSPSAPCGLAFSL